MKTVLQQAIEQIEERKKYLFEAELKELEEIDKVDNPLLRPIKWQLINDLAARRSELEMYVLKPLIALLPAEREIIEQAYRDGQKETLYDSRADVILPLCDSSIYYDKTFTDKKNNMAKSERNS